MNFIENIDPDHNYFERQDINANFSECLTYFSIDEFNTMVKNSPNHITLLNFNIRSFYANFDEFSCLFSDNLLPEIIVFTETWFDMAMNITYGDIKHGLIVAMNIAYGAIKHGLIVAMNIAYGDIKRIMLFVQLAGLEELQ